MMKNTLISRRGFTLGLAAIPFAASLAKADDDWAKVVAAAEAEGTLTVLGPPIQPYRLSILEFQKAYPKIKLEYTGGSSPEFEARLRNERRVQQYLWDVMVAGFSGTAFSEQIPAGWFDPLRPLITQPDVLDDSKWLGGFESGFLDANKQYLYAFQAGKQNNLNIDRSVIPEAEFSALEDLLDVKWKGKIAILDPRTRGSGHLVTLLLTALGPDKAKQFLVEQQPVLASSNRQLSDWVAAGAYPITSGLSPSEIAQLKDTGLAKGVQALATPPKRTAWTPGWGALALLHNAPHPNAARVFANWLLSQQAQADWAKRGFVNSRRKDVEPGLPISALDEASFRDGVTFNNGANAETALKAYGIAKEVLG